MPVIIGLVGDNEKGRLDVAQVMSDYFEVKNLSFGDAIKDIATHAFSNQLDGSVFLAANLDQKFEDIERSSVPVLKDNAQRIKAAMVRALGAEYRGFFSRVAPNKYVGGTYETPRALLQRVEQIVRQIIEDFFPLTIASKVGLNDVAVVNDFNDSEDYESLRSKYANFFLIHVGTSKYDGEGAWYSESLFDSIVLKDKYDLSSEDDLKSFSDKVQESLKRVKTSVKKEVPIPTDNALNTGTIQNGKFNFGLR